MQDSDAPIRQESDAPSPDYDDVLALRYAASVLYQLYVSTGDERFYQARDALIKDLPVELFEPPMPLSRSNSGTGSNPSATPAPSQEEPAVPVSVSGTDTEPQADDATDPEPDGQEDET